MTKIKLIPHIKKRYNRFEITRRNQEWAIIQKTALKVIGFVMFDIDNHEKEILSVGYENKTIETEENGIN